MNADKIILLEDGRIRAEGRHEQLISADPVYAKLWDLSESAADWVLKAREGDGV